MSIEEKQNFPTYQDSDSIKYPQNEKEVSSFIKKFYKSNIPIELVGSGSKRKIGRSLQCSITLNLSIGECIFILFVSSLVLSIPSAPANIGTFEAGVIYAMAIIGDSLYQLEFAIILHMVTFFPYVIIGGLFFIYYNYPLLLIFLYY